MYQTLYHLCGYSYYLKTNIISTRFFDHCVDSIFCVLRFILYYTIMKFLEQISEKYEEVHRSQDGVGIKTLDFFVKKKTDHYNNLINT